jgi:indolepyruvate ferredoxin oxidoreductase
MDHASVRYEPSCGSSVSEIVSMKSSNTPDVPNKRINQKEGRVYLSGMQALIRLMTDQHKRDKQAGLRVGGFVSGYPGSPLGGLEGALKIALPLLNEHSIRHVAGQNEELAATALIGTQMLDEHPHPDFDGVVAYWYGKGPGVDRASDAFKHGNFAGTSKHGAVVVLSGEDHEAKSSTVPYQQEFAFEHFGMPILQPASTKEIITLGTHAVALSRYSGCWVALKLTAPICDSGETVDLSEVAISPTIPEFSIDGHPFQKNANFLFFPIVNVARERNLYVMRHAAVHAYARANRLDEITVRTDADKIGIISSGKSYTDTKEALLNLGFDDEALKSSCIRLLKLGLLYPIDPEIIRKFADGLDLIIVVEEKRDFLEKQVALQICNLPKVPKLIGKTDLDGSRLFPVEGGMDFDVVTRNLARVLKARVPMLSSSETRLNKLVTVANRAPEKLMRRAPTYCSGCPHNIGTKLAPGQIAWGAPGCHVFAAIMPEPYRRIEAVTQFGGEGLPWIGLSPFTSRKHIVQNIGDGSLFHSSYLNIRFAIATKTNITFKILYNGAIANTGGQPPVGAKTIPELVRLLIDEGVSRIILITRSLDQYRGTNLPSSVEFRPDTDIELAQEELARTPGVTVLIHDGQCANERRRRRKRSQVPISERYTLVNEDVCENCGDCGQVSSCMSLHKVETEFGKKTTIHQSSCNQDMSCIRGECPSFVTVTVEPGTGLKAPMLPEIAEADLTPVALPSFERAYQVCMPGVGGTGVITLNAILAQAATLDGLRAISFDLTGAAQKWGPVLSNLIVTRLGSDMTTNHVGVGKADLYLALDMLTGADAANLAKCAPEKTAAVINESVLPTGEMIRNVDLTPIKMPFLEVIGKVSDAKRNVTISAGEIAEREFGDYMLTNMVTLGAAYQAGLVPISSQSIEQAIRLNNVQVDKNIAAFRRGRLEVCKPDKKETLRPPTVLADRVEEAGRTSPPAARQARDAILASCSHVPHQIMDKFTRRVEDLILYQNQFYAEIYTQRLEIFALAAQSVLGSEATPLIAAAVENLYKLMAYKDEYEVARLLTQSVFRQRTKEMFASPASLNFHLQPPLLRYFGMKRKVRIGEWAIKPLSMLYRFRFLRGTVFDPFAYAEVRRAERSLIDWYSGILVEMVSDLTPARLDTAIRLARTPEQIRGYEAIKLANARAARAEADQLLAALRQDERAESASAARLRAVS